MSDRTTLLQMVIVLCQMLIDEIKSPPSEGGWVRTENTAFRANASNLSASKVPKVPKRPKGHRKAYEHKGFVTCKKCGRHGSNSRTCVATFAAVKVGDMVPIPEKVRRERGFSLQAPSWKFTDQKHREPITARHPKYKNRY
jgi:hypothetical protein